jgi:thymidylate kinase
MIIELFGPPGVGKTTLASALADRLRERGRDVKLVLSHRPSEDPLAPLEPSAGLHMPAALRRLVRPIIETVAAAGRSANSSESQAVVQLMRLLPTRNVVQSLRVRQYLLRLSRTWYGAALTGDIVLFDQGFVQAVYTSALVTKGADPQRIGLALDAVPEADLLIRLHVPLQILEARLAERRRHQGRIEQLLDAWTDLGSGWIFDQLHELLHARGRRVTCLETTDQHSLARGVSEVEGLVLASVGEISPGSGAAQNGAGSWG